jgi:hypothetical protein
MFTFPKLMVTLVLAIAAVVVLFAVLGFLAGIAWFFVKLVVVVAILALVVRYFIRKS